MAEVINGLAKSTDVERHGSKAIDVERHGARAVID